MHDWKRVVARCESHFFVGNRNHGRKPNQETYTHAYVRAGPRRHLHFDPDQVTAAIVTCGGLCPVSKGRGVSCKIGE
jgi:hypothetical protein